MGVKTKSVNTIFDSLKRANDRALINKKRISIQRLSIIYRAMSGDKESQGKILIFEILDYLFAPTFSEFLELNEDRIQLFEEVENE